MGAQEHDFNDTRWIFMFMNAHLQQAGRELWKVEKRKWVLDVNIDYVTKLTKNPLRTMINLDSVYFIFLAFESFIN